MASLAARATALREASHRDAPRHSMSSTPSPPLPRPSSSSRAPSPTATPVTALPSMRPSVGMEYCGFHQGDGRTAAASAYARKVKAATPRQPRTWRVMPCVCVCVCVCVSVCVCVCVCGGGER